jgi:dUTP pyrophosphatase
MDKDSLEEYLKKLKEFESDLSSDDEVDDEFFTQINKVLGNLMNDVSKDNIVPNPSSFEIPVKVKKLHENAVIPSYSKDGDAGMDLTITREIENTTSSASYGFGLAFEIPKGYVGLVFPRSSIRNQELLLSNSVGVIDSGYRGEIQATFVKTNGLDSMKYKVGERGAQIIIIPFPKVTIVESDELSNTERGEGGFGSTGK